MVLTVSGPSESSLTPAWESVKRQRVWLGHRAPPGNRPEEGRRLTIDPVDGATNEGDQPPARAGYRRSTGSSRGEARRRGLLERVADDLVVNGLADFSLRRAARAAGTTHKVLLYYFDGVEDLLTHAVVHLRERRIAQSLAVGLVGDHSTLGDRVRAMWPILSSGEGPVLEQAIGLAMYDPARYSGLGREATEQYLPPLLSVCPPEWSERRKLEVAEMILATLRGFLVARALGGGEAGIKAGFEALARALDREQAALT
jgi:AcrR family transcriptional regulator